MASLCDQLFPIQMSNFKHTEELYLISYCFFLREADGASIGGVGEQE